MPKRNSSSSREIAKASRNHEALMRKVERLISKVYAIKADHPHQLIWWSTSALEIYKAQATIMFRILTSDKITDAELPDFEAMRVELTRSLEHICDLVQPLLKR